MAAVADAFASKLIGILKRMPKKEVETLLRAPGEITKLETALRDLSPILADAERRRFRDSSEERWMREVKDAMYDADDILDICQILESGEDPMLAERSAPWRRNILLSSCFSNQVVPHQIGIEIKALNRRLEDVMRRSYKFQFTLQAIGSTRYSSYSETGPVFLEQDIVGLKIQEDRRKLCDLLVNSMDAPTRSVIDNVVVVAITGAAGIGKTTLARMVFNDPMVVANFDVKIWLSVTQEVNGIRLLRESIAYVDGNADGVADSMHMLQERLNRALMGRKRFLLVMDDVWSDKVWNDILGPPLNGGRPGSRVLVTTRNDEAARGMRAQHLHRVTTLDPDDSWLLLKKQVSLAEDERDIDDLKYTGMMIVEKCNGLPLAIKVIGGLLRRKARTRESWFGVLNHYLGSSGAQFGEVFHSLYLSYQDLSPQLKQCFLYCSLLPKGVNFDSPNVINMWISEGFIHQADRRADELEYIGTEYHQDLIMRHLIEPGASSSMHDSVRSFAQHMAREEALVVHRELQTEVSSPLLSKLRRLSIESAESVAVEWADYLQKLVALRVLIINRTINFKPGDSWSSFSSLRVLHVVRLAESDRLVRSICQLKHLRYLYLYDSDISSLPDDIHRMKFLQHIGIVNCGRFVELPVNIIKLTQLRSLDLVGSSVGVVPRGFGRLTNLRSLFGFPVHRDGEGQGWCSLEELAPLRKLRSLRLEGIEKVGVSYLAEEAMISSMEHLISLHLNCSTSISANVTNSERQLIQEVYEHLFPPRCVENLVMETYIGRWLPNWMWGAEAAAFGSLRYMVLRNLASCVKLPDGLCQIPCLERLEINKAPLVKHVGHEFLRHGDLQCAFPRLQELVLHGMVQWRGWVWDPLNDVQVMPALEVLLVERCRLRSFPPGLSCHATALRHLVIAHARRLESLEAFSSLVELDICLSPRLSKIANLPRLQKLTIKICPKLRVLEGVPALRSLVLEDYTMETLPGYLQLQDDVCPVYLTLDCTIKLLKSISMGKGGPEWPKFSHIQHVNAYAEDGGHQRKWSVLYTREPFSFGAYMPDSDSDSDSEENLADDKLVRSDIRSDGSTDSQTDDELDDNDDIPTAGSTGVDLFNDDSELVGIESPREQIIKMLMEGRHTDKQQLQVVSIYGIGGLGKTTIARSVYRQISNQFECCAQVSVSERPDIVGIMKSIIDQVRCPYSSMEEFSNMQDNLQVIINVLKEFLEDKRYLIFIDDIWEVSVWETIKPTFIGNNHGSGIIATTYKLDVAESIGGVYSLPLLSDEDSKLLFYRRTCFRSEAGCPSSYRDVSKRLLNKCSRLPLAIITITRLLPASLNSEEEWKKVCNSIDSGFELGDRVSDMRRILSRSYHDLPQHLRTCFLYLSIFPENYDIRRDSLVQRWLSEDLIRGDHGQNLHELGESYFYQLLDTGMIQPIEFDNDGNALACRVPLVMIDLIAYLLIKEKHNTTSASQRRTDPPNKVERLSLQVSKKEKHAVVAEASKSFREGSLSISCSSDSVGTCPIIKNLRVLVLEGSLEDRHVAKYLGRSSRQLRYLILASTQITVIPKKVGNLQFLQTLDLRATRVIELPRTFVRLKQLHCLLINRSTKVPAGISNLQALKELQDIDISKSPDILEGICTLSKLRVLKVALWSWDDSSSKLLPETLCKLSTSELEHLSISTCCSLEFKPNDDVQKVFQHITKLEVQHSTFNTLPTWIDKLKKLSSLSIEVYLLEEDALRILGGLPALLFLSLTAKKTPEARPTAKRTPDGRVVTEDKLVVHSNGFGCLKTFHLFSRAMVIKFEKGSMKSLERLKLSFQASLATEDFSFGLGNLSSLKHIQVEIICFSATEKAVKKAEDAIRDMIWGSSGQPRPALDIRRSAEEYKIEDKKEFREEVRVLSLASRDGRTASVQKQNQKQKID
ncbi:uncharacterized protein LOC112875982 isoform X2 [Panicum hallii]|nr:uncharacterized protein LOC112875982 isoform X2 [Panicum hallii]